MKKNTIRELRARPARLTKPLDKATLVGLEFLHPNLEDEVASISGEQLLANVRKKMSNEDVTADDLLKSLNVLYTKGHLSELEILNDPDRGLVIRCRGNYGREVERNLKRGWRARYTACGLKYTICFLTPEQQNMVLRLHRENLELARIAIAQAKRANLEEYAELTLPGEAKTMKELKEAVAHLVDRGD